MRRISGAARGATKRTRNALAGDGIAGSGFYVMLTQVIGKGTFTLTSILLANVLSVSEFASYTYFFVTSALLSSYISFGIPLSAVRVISEGAVDRSWSSDERVGAIVVLSLAAALVAAFAAPFYMPLLLPDEIPLAGAFVVAGAIAAAWAALAQAAIYANGGFREAFWPVLAGSVLLVAAVAFSLVVHSLAFLIAANIASMLIPTIAYVRHLARCRVVGWASVRRIPRWPVVRAVLAIALPGLGVTTIYATMNWLAARALVEHQGSPDQFNQFALGMQWFALVLFIPLAFGQVLFPRFVQQAHAGALPLGAIIKPAGFTFAVVLACAVIGAAGQPLLPLVYGPQYDFPRVFVFTILVAAAFGGAVNLLGSYVMAIRGTGTWFGVNLVSPAVGLPVIVWAPPTTAFESARLLCLCYGALTLVAVAVIWRHRRVQRPADVSPHADAMLRREMDYPPAI